MHRAGDREILNDQLTSIVRNVLQDQSPIVSINSRLSNYSSSFASYIISVGLADDREHTIFLKDYGDVRRPVQQLRERRNRELRVYQEVLGKVGLGTARFYGSVWSEAEERFWLFLEYVDGKPLKESGFECWLAAAGWLGRLYGYSIENSDFLAGCAFLCRHDEKFFEEIAQRAHAEVSSISPVQGHRLASVLNAYGQLIKGMVAQHPVLVHGSFGRQQILLDSGARPRRTCPVDWESAALGDSLFDLAYLTDGYTPPELDEMIEAYRNQLGKYAASTPSMGEIVHLLNCYRLHRNIKWLSWARTEKFSQELVVRLVARAERLANLVI